MITTAVFVLLVGALVDGSFAEQRSSGSRSRKIEDNDPPIIAEAVGLSDSAILWISCVGFGLLSLVVYRLLFSNLKSMQEIEQEEGQYDHPQNNYEDQLIRADITTLNRSQRRARAKALMKRNRNIEVPLQQQQQPQEEEEDNNDGDNNNNNAVALMQQQQQQREEHHLTQQLSRKERQKKAKLLEKEERRLNEEIRRKKQQEQEQIIQQQKKERDRVLQAAKAEQKAQQEEHKQLLKHLEYQKWKMMFFWDDDNDDMDKPTIQNNMTVEEFIQLLEKRKQQQRQHRQEKEPLDLVAISLQELVSYFFGSNDDNFFSIIQDRLHDLIQSGRLNGIVDQQNQNFIYIQDDEMEQLATYILNPKNTQNRIRTSNRTDINNDDHNNHNNCLSQVIEITNTTLVQ